MGRRRTALTALLAASVVPLSFAAPVAVHAAEPPTIVSTTPAFSPNGDGVADTAQVTYTLPGAGAVSIGVRFSGGWLFRSELGQQDAGQHTWTWDGRLPDGRPLPEEYYTIEVATADSAAESGTAIDLHLDASVWSYERFGRSVAHVPRIWPRTTVVRDSLSFDAFSEPGAVEAAIEVRDRRGRIVHRWDLVRYPLYAIAPGGASVSRQDVWFARDRRNRPLPAGRYTVVVRGVDAVGNAGASELLEVRVSHKRLEWVRETHRVQAARSRVDICALWGCGHQAPVEPSTYVPVCGKVVPSTRIAEGLTHRAGGCPEPNIPLARSTHYLPVPRAVRGVGALRVAFAGAPTSPGATDVGTVRLERYPLRDRTATSGTGARTRWSSAVFGSRGLEGGEDDRDGFHLDVLPGAFWDFETTGTDSFDVASFTVDVRYLAVED